MLTTKQDYNGCRGRSHCGNKDGIVNDKKVSMTATGSLSIARSTAVCEKKLRLDHFSQIVSGVSWKQR